MNRLVLYILSSLLLAWRLPTVVAAEGTGTSASAQAVRQLFGSIASDLRDAKDRAALEQLIAAFTERGTIATHPTGPWVLLTFNRAARLEAVEVSAERLLLAPPLIQHAVILHELEHVKWAQETRRALEALSAQDLSTTAADETPDRGQKLRSIIRILVEDEVRAYRRDIVYVNEIVNAHGGFSSYLETLPQADRGPVQQYYQQLIQRFVTDEGAIDERRLRRDFIFLETFPHRYRRYYEAALSLEAMQGHVELRRGPDGTLRCIPLIAPTAFLAWLLP